TSLIAARAASISAMRWGSWCWAAAASGSERAMSTEARFSPCLLVPCYNHGAQIRATLEALQPFGLPLILVDDGSASGTAVVLDQLAAADPAIDLLRLPENRGKGAAVAAGVERAAERGFSHALQIDADGQHDVADIPA